MISPQELLRTRTVDELNRSAEEYFAKIKDPTCLLAKPFNLSDHCSRLLQEFAVLLAGLDLWPLMDVIDFGAGSCWSSYFLSQAGCKVYPVDVSETALNLGRRRYAEHPPFGATLAPEFLVFDGHRIQLPDQSVDRIMCMHALHHVPNPRDVFFEMARVLRHDGIAGFCEPGPDHSKGALSQSEMKAGVLENDIVIEDLWEWARDAGFKQITLAVYGPEAARLSLPEYQKFIAGSAELDGRVIDPIRGYAKKTRTFFLHKEAVTLVDSRVMSALMAEIQAEFSGPYREGGEIRAKVCIRNTGTATWLESGLASGAVNLGCHLVDLAAGEFDRDYVNFRGALRKDGGNVQPGESVTLEVKIPCPAAGVYEIQLDLVSEHVCWFGDAGKSEVVKVRIEVGRV